MSSNNAQIANIENVMLTAAATLNLANQLEGFTITGSSDADVIVGGRGADNIAAGFGNDVIAGADTDTLLDGGAGADVLQVGSKFTSASNAQIFNIDSMLLMSAVSLNLSNQTEGFAITGSLGADSITAGSGNDVIVGAQNDTLLNGGAGMNTLQLGANFASTSNGQITNIENVLVTVPTTLNISNQTESFTITGSSGDDNITAGSAADKIATGPGSDVIFGAQNDTLLDGGIGIDVLRVGSNFTSASDAQIVNIESIVLTSPLALNLSNQSEGFTIVGSSGADSITAGSGNDGIVGAQNDTLLNGGAGIDTLQIGSNFASVNDTQIVKI